MNKLFRRFPSRLPGSPRAQVAVLVALIALLGVLQVTLAGGGEVKSPTHITLTQALADVKAGKVAKATVDDNDRKVLLEYKPDHKVTIDPADLTAAPATDEQTREQAEKDLQARKDAAKDADPHKAIAEYPYIWGDDLTKALLDAQVRTSTDPLPTSNAFTSMLTALLPVAAIILFLMWMLKSGAMTGGVGKMSGKRGKAVTDIPNVTFTDVAGADEAVAELREFVEFLKDPHRFEKVGAKRPAGALLVGPPGTGKTLLARAVAGEAGVPVFAVAGSDFVETYVGVGARRVRDLFEAARAAAPSIVFLDEIDSVAAKRSSGGHGGTVERDNTLISLLNEMDGFAASNVIVLAATNRPDILDPAITRPGRLDRQIQVPNPDRRGRTHILAVHAKSRPLSEDVDLVALARRTPGFSGADLAQLINEACMEAARRGLDLVDQDCLDAAVATVAMGRARTSALVTDFDRRVTAWHEAGHTLAAMLEPHADDPVQVTIIPRGIAGGVTWMSGNDNIFLTRQQALAKLTVALSGRAAEEVLLDGEHTQGASGDLASATTLATAMVTQYGMTDFGFAQVDEDAMRLGSHVAAQARLHVEALLRQAHQRAEHLMLTHRGSLVALAEALLAEETLNAEAIRVAIAADSALILPGPATVSAQGVETNSGATEEVSTESPGQGTAA